jgi:DNA-binding HxlR family transcriptional regulator
MNKNMKECPINVTFRIMGKKFTVLILRNMINLGQTRFNQFLKIEEINAKILSARLREMEQDGLIERKIFHERPVSIEYTLTEKGEALKPLLGQMASYSMQHYAKEVFKDGKVRSLEEVYGCNLS